MGFVTHQSRSTYYHSSHDFNRLSTSIGNDDTISNIFKLKFSLNHYASLKRSSSIHLNSEVIAIDFILI